MILVYIGILFDFTFVCRTLRDGMTCPHYNSCSVGDRRILYNNKRLFETTFSKDNPNLT